MRLIVRSGVVHEVAGRVLDGRAELLAVLVLGTVLIVEHLPWARLRCGSCAGARVPVFFLADDAASVTSVGTADSVAPGAAAGALWLTSYPPGAAMSSAAGYAQEVSVAGAPLGTRLRLSSSRSR
jgi:hypothetical protein